MNKLMKMSVLLLSSMFVFNACSDKNNDPEPDNETPERVLILNEGGFLKGNASIDVYNVEGNQLEEDVFFSKNNRPLGDVLQSVTVSGNQLYWIVNNSGKIEVTDQQLRSVGTITGFTSPRNMAVLNGKGYVTDLFSGKIWVTDLASAKITDSIVAPGWSEGILAAEGEIWVARPSQKYIYRIDVTLNTLKDSIELPSGASELVSDNKGNIWVLCGGNQANNVKASVVRIRLSDRTVIADLPFEGQYPSRLRYNAGMVYFVVGGEVFRVAEDASTAGLAWLSAASAYGLNIDPQTQNVWVGNARDFSGKSEVSVYDPQGNKIKSLETGVATNGFLFLN